MKSIKVALITVCISFCLVSGAWAYSGGTGTVNDPYHISKKADLLALAGNVGDSGKCFILTTDIDLSGETFIDGVIKQFSGVFDGNGYVITNLIITSSGKENVGFFGYIMSSGKVRNLGLKDASITGNYKVGGLVGYNDGGSITRCYVTGAVYGGSHVGGLVGYSDRGVVITSCYATCAVSGDSYWVGGLVGTNYGSINRCFSAGVVSGTRDVGGLVGVGFSSGVNRSITSSFWDIQASGQASCVAGKGLTTQQMKTVDIFQNAGWADKSWVINDGIDYPHLAWEQTGGIPIPQPQPVPLFGSGSEQDPYQVWTANDFALLSWHVSILDKHILLMADLDLTEVFLYPVGDLGAFTGIFNGAGHVIRNAIIDHAGKDCVGLFGILGGQIRRLGVEDAAITGRNCTGGLVGATVYESSIIDCYVTGTVHGESSVGGLVGNNSSYGAVTKCYATCTTGGTNSVGGLVGENSDEESQITSCYATGAVTGEESLGGLAGRNWGCINLCYSRGAVTNKSNYGYYTGGLVGSNTRAGRILYSYSTGEVRGYDCVGGLVGISEYWNIYHGTIWSCFFDIETSGTSTCMACGSANYEDCNGLTTAQMQAYSNFINAGWDFSDLDGNPADWQMPAVAGYPVLSWQPGPYEPIPHATLSVIANPSIEGLVSGGGTFPVGSPRTIKAISTADWTFTGWNDGDTNYSRTVTVLAGGASYTANFLINDADGDGISDGMDNCPNTPLGEIVDATGCSVSQRDTDEDGFSPDDGDCNDNSADINPDATEICDGIDNNCNGQIDEDCENIFYRDADDDGYGDPNNSMTAQAQPAGYVSNNQDCDDGDSAVHPGATEIGDDIDNNCNGQIDEGCINIYYSDTDDDGYGDPDNSITAQSQPASYVSNDQDCDDSVSFVHPGATEICDGVDNNCDGQIDEGCSASQYDTDGDSVMDDVDNCPSVYNPGQGDADGDSIPGVGGGNFCDDNWDRTCFCSKVKESGNLSKTIAACFLKEIKDKGNKYTLISYVQIAKEKLAIKWSNAETKASKLKKKPDHCYTLDAEDIAVKVYSALVEIYSRINSSGIGDNSGSTDSRLANKNYQALVSGLLTAASNRCVSLITAQSAYFKESAIAKNKTKAEDKLTKATAKADTTFDNAWSKAVIKAGKGKVLAADIPSDNDKEEIKERIKQLVEDIINM